MQKTIIKLFLIINIIIWLYLVLNALIYSWINVDLGDENVYQYKDSIVLNIVAVLLFFAVITFAKKQKQLLESFNTKKFALVLAFISVGVSIYWVIFSGAAPEADQLAICNAASQMNAGDYSEMSRGGYVAVYPQQLGLITLIRAIFYIFGDMNYIPFQVMSAFCTFGIVYSVYRISSILSKENKTIEILGTLLAFFCLPMYMYTSYVYGEILSTMLILLSILILLKLYNRITLVRIVGVAITLMGAVMARRNSVIFIIAIFGVFFIKIITSDRRKTFLILALTVLVSMIGQSLIIKMIYEDKWDEDSSHLPAIMWIAMGTNDDYERAGWYNGMGTIIFWEQNLDEEDSSEAAKDVIKNFIGICIDDPKYGIDFYNRKINSQWSAPMYQGLVMNNNFERKQSHIAYEIYNNTSVWKALDSILNIYQLIVYTAILVLLLSLFKSDWGLENYIGLITIFGGFLFSILWEAKSRYVFPYLMIMLPYAAIGIYNASSGLEKLINNRYINGKAN